jgi:hypothetical protein
MRRVLQATEIGTYRTFIRVLRGYVAVMTDPKTESEAEPEPTPVPPLEEAPSSTGVVIPDEDTDD